MARITLLYALWASYQLVSALQVTPNSPCAQVCMDSPGLDVSDPNSSTTTTSDIPCLDAEYSSPKGTKFRDCMSCLQTSTFSQGSESDIKWFLCELMSVIPGYLDQLIYWIPCFRQPQIRRVLLRLWPSQRHRPWLVSLHY